MNKIDPTWQTFINDHQLNGNQSSFSTLVESIESGNVTICQRLFEVIEASKQDLSIQKAASNAFDILNKACISLSDKDFTGVHINDVNLSGAIAKRANFNNAVLRNVSFINAKLKGATFDNTQLENVEFSDELYEPVACLSFKGHEGINRYVYTLCELSDGLFASRDSRGFLSAFREIKIWNSEKNFSCIKILEDDRYTGNSLTWLKKSKLLIASASAGFVVWDPKVDFQGILYDLSETLIQRIYYSFYELSNGTVVGISGISRRFFSACNPPEPELDSLRIFDPTQNFKCIQEVRVSDTYASKNVLIESLCELRDGCIALGFQKKYSDESEIVIFDPAKECPQNINYGIVKIIPLAYELGVLTGLCTNSKGHLLSSHRNGTFKVWDPKQDFKCIQTVSGLAYNGRIYAISENLIAFSSKYSIDLRPANADYAISAQILDGYNSEDREIIPPICRLTNGFLIGGFRDGTIKVWKPKKKVSTEEINPRVTSKMLPFSSDVKRFTRTYNLEVLLSYFKNMESSDTSTVDSKNTDTSIKELENLFEQLLDELIYLFNDSTMKTILAGEDTRALPFPYQYAKAAHDSICGNSVPLNQLLTQGKSLDRPILFFFDELTVTNKDSNEIAACLILPCQYTLPTPYFKNDLVIQQEKAKVMIWCSQSFSKPNNNPVVTFEHSIKDGKLNFKLVYDIVMSLCKETVKDKMALDPIEALCDSFYEQKINSFLKKCNEAVGLTLRMRKDRKYIPLTEYLEGYAIINPDPKSALKVYQLLSPQYQEFITAVVKEVCAIADERGLLPNNISITLDNFKVFLQIALYRNNLLQQVLKQAYQQKWLSKPFHKLNLMNLTVLIALSFEEGGKWDEMMQSIREFKSDNYDQYEGIVSFLDAKVLKAITSTGLASRSWYDQMAQKLSLFRHLCDIVRSETVFSLILPTSSITPVQAVHSVNALPTVFPAKDLGNILSIIKELDLEEILAKTVEKEETPAFSFLSTMMQGDTSLQWKILAANLTCSRICSIWSTSNLSLSNVGSVFLAWYRGESLIPNMSQPNEALYGDKLSGIMRSANELQTYFNAFYILQEGNSVLDHQALVLKLLQDRDLYNLLTNEDVVEQLASLCAAVRIPSLKLEEAKRLIAVFTNLQELVFELLEKQKVSNTRTSSKDVKLKSTFDKRQINHPMSFLVGDKTFVAQETEGDGACALHASLGTKQGNRFYWQDKAAARRQFASDLKNNFTRPEVKNQFLEVIKVFIGGRGNGEFALYFTKLKDSSPEAGQLINDYVNRAKIRGLETGRFQKNRQKSLIDLVDEIFTNKNYSKAKIQLEELLGLSKGYSLSTTKICGENIDTLTGHFTTNSFKNIEFWKEWDASTQELAKLEKEENADLAALCSEDKLRETYLQIILQLHHWFTSDEMELIALVYEINIQEFHRTKNKIELSHNFNSTGKTRRIVFFERSQDGKGSHYWRCEEEIPQVSQVNNTTSNSSEEYKPIPKISSYSDLLTQLLHYNPQGISNLGVEILSFIPKLEQVIKIYLQPQIFSMQLLAHPIIEKMLKTNVFESPLERMNCIKAPENIETYYDCGKVFKEYGSSRLGEFVSDPMDNYIHSKSLEMYYFTTKEEEGGTTIQNTLCINVKRFSFKEFSFQRSEFHNFDFTQTYFEGCDFSDVTFSGVITFSETYMDAITAKTFLHSLRRSLIFGGNIKIAGQKGIILVSLKDVEKNEVQSIPRELSAHIDTKHSNWLTLENYLPTFEKPTSKKSVSTASPSPKVSNTMDPTQHSQQHPPSSYLDYMWGGLGSLASMGANATGAVVGGTYSAVSSVVVGTVQGLQTFCEAGIGEHAADILENNEAEISKSIKLEKKLEKLQKKILNDQKKQEAINAHLGNVQRDHSSVIEEQEILINNITEYIVQLQNERRGKKQILREQEQLLTRKDLVTVFYQTFLMELCSSLQAILVLQNSLKLIDPSQGQVTKISNKQEKCGSLIEIVEKNPSKLTKAYQWIMAGKDHIIGMTDLIKPVLSILSGKEVISSSIVAVINPILDIAQKTNDQDKLGKSKAVCRGLTIKTLEKMADAIARKISFAYEDQIQLLSYEGAIRFAECGVLRIIAALFNGYLDPSEPFVTQAWLAVRKLKTDHNTAILGIEIPYTNRKIQSKKNKNIYFTEDDLYRLSGVAYRDEEGTLCCYSNDIKNEGNSCTLSDACVTKANQIGYMRVSKEEWKEHFRHSVTLDNSDDLIQQSLPQSIPNSKNESLPIGKFLVFDQGKIMDKTEELEKKLAASEIEKMELAKRVYELEQRIGIGEESNKPRTVSNLAKKFEATEQKK